MTTKAVCRSCNNTWMSVLDDETSRVAVPLVRGQHRVLTTAEQLLIGYWASMKSAVADARPDDPNGGLISESIRAAIFDRHLPPDDMMVRLAAFDEGQTFAPLVSFGVGNGQAGQHLAQWVTTLVCGHLIVQVVGRTGARAPGVLDQVPWDFFDETYYGVWPPRPHVISWPPQRVLDRAALEDFLFEPYPEGVRDQMRTAHPMPATPPCPECGQVHGGFKRALPLPG